MSGWLTNGLSLAKLPLTGNELIPADTQLAAGGIPETESISLSQLSLYVGGGGVVPWRTSQFYGAPPSITPVATITTASTIAVYPLFIPAVTIKTLNLSVTTGQSGANAHIGIYADNGSGYPGTQVFESGAFGSLASTGIIVNTPVTPIVLNSGLYWIASIFTATGTFASVIGITSAYTNPLMAMLGSDTAAHLLATSGEAPTGLTSISATYGTLAATFPSGATLAQNVVTPVVGFGT